MCTLVTHSVLTEHYMLGSLSFWTAHMPFAGTCNAQNRAPTCCRAGSKHMLLQRRHDWDSPSFFMLKNRSDCLNASPIFP